MSGLLTGTAFTNQFPEINTTTGNGSDSLQGLVVAIYEIGCFAGSLFCLFAGEKLGRKNCIWLGCFILTIGAVLQTTAYGIPQMIVGRIVAGVGNGINTSTIVSEDDCVRNEYPADHFQPVWHAELMQAHKRGKGLSIEFAINIFGVSWRHRLSESPVRIDPFLTTKQVMLAYWVDYGFSYIDSAAQFRFPLALQILFALMTALNLVFLPESPRW
jgi:MFS family permease